MHRGHTAASGLLSRKIPSPVVRYRGPGHPNARVHVTQDKSCGQRQSRRTECAHQCCDQVHAADGMTRHAKAAAMSAAQHGIGATGYRYRRQRLRRCDLVDQSHQLRTDPNLCRKLPRRRGAIRRAWRAIMAKRGTKCPRDGLDRNFLAQSGARVRSRLKPN